MKQSFIINSFAIYTIAILIGCTSPAPVETPKSTTYEQLAELFKTWREFQKPVLKEGVPDYSVAAMQRQHEELKNWRKNILIF